MAGWTTHLLLRFADLLNAENSPDHRTNARPYEDAGIARPSTDQNASQHPEAGAQSQPDSNEEHWRAVSTFCAARFPSSAPGTTKAHMP